MTNEIESYSLNTKIDLVCLSSRITRSLENDNRLEILENAYLITLSLKASVLN